MAKVREVFERAYGAIPDGATCHVASQDSGGTYIAPYVGVPTFKRVMEVDKGVWKVVMYIEFSDLFGPDISDRDAEAFRGFFGDDYDAALDALTKEEGEKHDAQDWVDRYSGE